MSFSSWSQSWNFVLPQEYKDDQIRSISVYDRRAETKVLDAIDGRHCFCVI